jgi:tRNA1(Val) A37 N6-methylase TrmN6
MQISALIAVLAQAHALSVLPSRSNPQPHLKNAERNFFSAVFIGVAMTELFENERLDQVNDHLRIIQRTDGLTFGSDALLLAAFINRAGKSRALELGAGTGIISLLLATRKKIAHAECVEIQPAYASIAARNVSLNALDDTVCVTQADIRDLAAYGKEGGYDIVYTNPPYMRTDCPACAVPEKQLARHEVHGGIYDFTRAAHEKLRWGGRFFCVWRPDRLSELFDALHQGGMEPKRMTFVHASPALPPSVVLTESKRGGKPGLRVTPPLFIGGNLKERAESPQMCHILTEGSFPKSYE